MLRLRSAGALRLRGAPAAWRGREMVLRRPSARNREGVNDGHRRTSAGEQSRTPVRRSFRPQVRRRPRRSLPDRARRLEAGATAMTERERLPDRRGAELVDFEHGGRKWTATFGRFADGRIAELFIDGSKEAPIVELAQESAIVASLALQSGCALETLRHALAGRSAGPLGAALAMADGSAP